MDAGAGYPVLPEAILTVPAAYNAESGSGGSIAEALAVQTVKTAPTAAGTGQQAAANTPMAADNAVAAGTAVPDAAVALPAENAVKSSGTTVIASAASAEETLPGVVPASYAGPTPLQTAAQPFEQAPAPASPADLIHAPDGRLGPESVDARSPELDQLIARYADYYEVPEELVRRTVKRESTFNPKARNGPYWGLMQIRHDTAKGMGYQGSASGLLDAETNLKYAVRYLRGAFLVAKGDHKLADKLYQRGYYYDAKRAGLLDETGLGKDRRRRNPS